MASSSAGRAAAAAAGLPPWDALVQKFDLFSFQLAEMVLLPLGMHPHAESGWASSVQTMK